MYPAGFEPTIQGSERPQIHALDRAPTWFGIHDTYRIIIDLSRLISYKIFFFGQNWETVQRLIRHYYLLNQTVHLKQSFSTTRPRHQFYRVARGSPGICHFIFLSNFHEYMFYRGNILRRKIFMNVSNNSDPDVGLRKLQYATIFH